MESRSENIQILIIIPLLVCGLLDDHYFLLISSFCEVVLSVALLEYILGDSAFVGSSVFAYGKTSFNSSSLRYSSLSTSLTRDSISLTDMSITLVSLPLELLAHIVRYYCLTICEMRKENQDIQGHSSSQFCPTSSVQFCY